MMYVGKINSSKILSKKSQILRTAVAVKLIRNGVLNLEGHERANKDAQREI